MLRGRWHNDPLRHDTHGRAQAHIVPILVSVTLQIIIKTTS